MLPFLNAWVIRVHHMFGRQSLAEGAPAGALFKRAHQLGLLPTKQLSNRSIVFLTMNCPTDQVPGQNAKREFFARNLHVATNQGQVSETLLTSYPPPFQDILQIAHSADGLQRGLLFRLAEWHCGPTLLRFLARLLLLNHNDPRLRSSVPGHLVGAWAEFLKQPGADYKSLLYDQAVSFLGSNGQGPPNVWPAELPAWSANLTPGERVFLDCCLGLPVGQRCLAYLSFYAGLRAEQLTAILQKVRPSLHVSDVQQQLALTWDRLLHALAHSATGLE